MLTKLNCWGGSRSSKGLGAASHALDQARSPKDSDLPRDDFVSPAPNKEEALAQRLEDPPPDEPRFEPDGDEDPRPDEP